jgi:hypothetical protein
LPIWSLNVNFSEYESENSIISGYVLGNSFVFFLNLYVYILANKEMRWSLTSITWPNMWTTFWERFLFIRSNRLAVSVRKCIDGFVSNEMWQRYIIYICYSIAVVGSCDVCAALCCDACLLFTELCDWFSPERIQTYKNTQMETRLHGYMWRR